MDETARKMLPYNKEYELKEGKYPAKNAGNCRRKSNFFVQWGMVM